MPVVQAGDDVIEFPDSMSSEDIQSALGRRYQSKALDYALSAPQNAVSGLTRTLQSGAEGADMGRRQDLANQMQMARIEGASGRGQEQLLGGLEKAAGFVHEMDPLNLLKRTIALPQQITGGPQYEVAPAVSPETVRKGIDFFDPTTDEAGSLKEGVKRFLAETGSSFTSPDQAAALLAGKVAPELVGRQFQVQVAAQIPQATQSLVEALKSGDATEVGKSAASLAAAVAIPTAIEKGIRGKVEKGPTPQLLEPEVPRIPVQSPETVPINLELAPPEVPQTISEESPPSVVAGKANRAEAGEGSAVESGVAPPETPQAMAEPSPQPPIEQQPTVTSPVTEPKKPQSAKEWRKSVQDAIDKAPPAEFETITPSEDTPIGINDAGDKLYQRKDGQVYRMRMDRKDKPYGYPDFGGDLSPVEQPNIQGLGGAIPSEFDRTGSPTAMKYSKIDQERQQRGLEPLTKPEGTTDQATLDKAMAAIDQDPELPDRLVDQLNEKPRVIEDWENHVLMLRKIDLRNEYERSASEAAQAYDDSQKFPERKEDMQRANVRTAELSDKLEELEHASRVSGSARGRALRSLQVMLNEDYSLAGLERQKRASKGGAPLTSEERLELIRVSKELQASQKALADYQAGESQRRVEAAKKAIQEDRKKRPYVSPPILNAARRIVADLDSRADAARQRLRERAGRFSAGVDPTVLVDLAEIGMSHIAHAGLDFSEWSSRMVADVGDWVKPHLEEVFERSKTGIDAIGSKVKGSSEQVKKAIKSGYKSLGIEDQKKETIKAVKKAADNKEDIGYYAKRIARSFVEEGVEDTQELVDKVHEVLKEAIPELERRDTMDAISGYGDYKQLSKDEVTVKLRGMKGELQQLANLEDMAKGEPPLKSVVERRTPTPAEERLIREVNEAKRKFQIPITDPETQLKSPLDTLKKALQTRIQIYEERLAKGDFETKPKRPIEVDRKAQELQAQAERVKRKFQQGLIEDRLAKRRWWEKALDWATNYRRFGVLTSPTVIPKLMSAGLQRLVSLPMEELAGSALKVVPGVSRVARRAPLEGVGMNLRAEMKGYGSAFTQGMKDAYSTLKSGHSDLDVLYGKRHISPAGEFDLGGAILSFPGRLHGMFKAPVKRAVFERSVQRLGEFYAKQGLDVTDPLVKSRIGLEAYKAANAAIFLQDNFIAGKINAWLAPKIDKATGHPTVGSKVWQTTGRVLLPITKVPINIVGEAAKYAFGLGSGGTRLVVALARGAENLKPEQADLIMQELKKGSVGAAALLIGYFNPDSIGGYYQPGQKRDPEDVKAGHIKLFGIDIPSWLLHNPLLETFQIGATIRRVADHIPSNKNEPEGLGWGALAGALGVTEQIPFVREQETIAKVLGSSSERHAAVGELARDIVVPQALQFGAKQMDMTDEGVIKRKTDTLGDYIKSGVPGLRQQLETK